MTFKGLYAINQTNQPYLYKMDLALNNLQWLICDKSNQPTNQPANQ